MDSSRFTATAEELWFTGAGARLFAITFGRGKPLVFLHGGLSDHRGTLLRLRAADDELRIVAPDVRGSGRSIDHGPLDWDRLADDVVALLDRLALPRAIVGGISAGSSIALRFALRHPQRLAALVLVAPVAAGADRGHSEAQRVAKRAIAAAGERVRSEGIAGLLPLYERLPAEIRALALEMAGSFDPGSVVATTRLLASDAQPFATIAELRAIAVPTLIVPGSDPEHPAELATRYAEQLPHAVLGDPQEELARTVATFCRGVPD